MNLSYFLSWVVFRSIYRTLFRCRYYHSERVPANGPAILAANHASFIDPPFVASGSTRGMSFLARESLFHNPVLGAILRSWGVVPVDRDGGGARGLKVILDRLARGGAIVLFPEGTRTSDGRLQPAKAGIGLTIIKSSCPVVPVRLFGTYEAYPKGRKYPRLHPLAITFGRPLQFEQLRAEAKQAAKGRLKEIYQEAADAIMNAISELEPCREVRRFPE